MKKFLAILLAITLVFSFAACGKKGENLSNNDLASSTTQSTDFVAPENYVSILTVKINPTFNIYLDADNKVLAVQAVNEDAKSLESNINLQDNTLKAVLENIVTVANDNGFITKDEKDISISLTEVKDLNLDGTDILEISKRAVDDTSAKLNLSITVTVKDTSSEEQSSSKPNTTVSNTSSKNDDHVHSYREANCTAPKTCPCGATEGKALGHVYKFNDSICSRCGATDPNYKTYTSVFKKAGFWTCRYIVNAEVGEQLYDATLIFKAPAGEQYENYEDNMIFVGGSRLAEPGDITYYPEEVFEYNGKKYIGAFGNGGGELGKVTENGNTVNLTHGSDSLTLQRTGENTFKVASTSGEYSDLNKIPVGTVITFSANLN